MDGENLINEPQYRISHNPAEGSDERSWANRLKTMAPLGAKIGGEKRRDTEQPNTPEDWFLCLLYAPNEEGKRLPIVGETQLMLAFFILDQRFEKIFDKDLPFDFKSTKSGPVDADVYKARDSLLEKDYIEVTADEDHDSKIKGRSFSLTRRGKDEAKSIYSSLESKHQEEIIRIKYHHARSPIGELLLYVFGRHSHMFEGDIFEG